MPRFQAGRSLVIALGLAAQAGVAAPPQPNTVDNPALEKFSESLVFYAGYDGHPFAELTPGDPEPAAAGWQAWQASEPEAFVAGAFNQAMRTGAFELRYNLGEAASLADAGGAALWVATAGEDAEGEPSYFPFFKLRSGQRLIMSARMGKAVNKRQLFAHLKSGRNAVSAVRGSMAAWEPGVFHLMVINWGPDWIEFSLDGRAPFRQSIASPEGAAGRGATLTVAAGHAHDAFFIDELMLFSRGLTAQDIDWLMSNGPAQTDASPADK